MMVWWYGGSRWRCGDKKAEIGGVGVKGKRECGGEKREKDGEKMILLSGGGKEFMIKKLKVEESLKR